MILSLAIQRALQAISAALPTHKVKVDNRLEIPRVCREQYSKKFKLPIHVVDQAFAELVRQGKLRRYWLSGVIPRHGDWTPKWWFVTLPGTPKHKPIRPGYSHPGLSVAGVFESAVP